MTEDFWQSVLALKTFNSSAGRTMQREAKPKLQKLEKTLPVELVEQVYAFYVEDAPYDLWPATKTTRDEHAPVLVKALGKCKDVQAVFLREAFGLGGAEALRRAGKFLSTLALNSHVPGMMKSLGKKWAQLERDDLPKAASAALSGRGRPDLTETLAYYGLLYLVARSNPRDPVIAKVQKAHEGNDPHEVVPRVLKAAAE